MPLNGSSLETIEKMGHRIRREDDSSCECQVFVTRNGCSAAIVEMYTRDKRKQNIATEYVTRKAQG